MNLHRALMFAAIGTAGCLLLQVQFRLPSVPADLSTWNHWGELATPEELDPGVGPVLVTVKYQIDPARASEFLHLIHMYERVRRRDGATNWGIFVDTGAADTYLETFKIDSWAEHQRQHDRFTVADREIEAKVLAYAVQPVEVRHFIYAPDREPPLKRRLAQSP